MLEKFVVLVIFNLRSVVARFRSCRVRRERRQDRILAATKKCLCVRQCVPIFCALAKSKHHAMPKSGGTSGHASVDIQMRCEDSTRCEYLGMHNWRGVCSAPFTIRRPAW